MALQIDRKKTALLVMDVENDIVHKDGAAGGPMGFAAEVERRGTLKNIRKILDKARATGMTVLYVEVMFDLGKREELPKRGDFPKRLGDMWGKAVQKGTWGGEIHEDVKPLPDEQRIGKWIVSSFSRSKLDAVLKEKGITDLILTGVATNMVVEATARDAFDRGYSLVIVEDGVASFSPEAHEFALNILRMFADVASTDEVVRAIG
jgi:nicotinamidase-related amidase